MAEEKLPDVEVNITSHSGKAKKELDAFAKGLDKAAKAGKKSAAGLDKLDDALDDLKGGYEKLKKAGRDVVRAQERIERATKKVEEALKSGNRQTIKAAKDGLALAKAELASAKAKKQSIADAVSATQENIKYDAALEKMIKTVQQGVAANENLADANDNVAKSTGRATKAVEKGSRQYSAATSRARNMQFAVQNASFQVADLATQLELGVNPARALSQQGSQLLGAFGPMGAAMGAVVAIGVPLGAMLATVAGSAKSAGKAMENLDATMDSLKGRIEANSLTMDELVEKYGDAAGRVRDLNRDLTELAIAEATRQIANQVVEIKAAVKQYAGFQKELDNTAGRMKLLASARGGNILPQKHFNSLRKIEKNLGVVGEEAKNLAEAFTNLAQAPGAKAQEAAFYNLRDALEANNVELGKLPEAAQKGFTELGNYFSKLAELEKLKKDAAASGADENLNPPAPLDVPAPKYGDSDISGFVESLLTQEEAMKASQARRLDILNAATEEQLAAVGGRLNAQKRLYQKFDEELQQFKQNAGLAELDRLEFQLLSEDERKIANFEKQIEQAKTNAETLLALDKWTSDERIEIEQRTADAIAAIRGQIAAVRYQQADEERRLEEEDHRQRQQAYDKLFNDLAFVADAGSKKLGKIVRAAGAAQAVANSYIAFTEALKNPPGPPFSYAQAAAALASGLRAVQSIKSSGSGGGGGGGGSAPAAAAAPPAPLNVRVSGLSGNQLLSGADVSSLLTRLQDEAGDRGLILTTVE